MKRIGFISGRRLNFLSAGSKEANGSVMYEGFKTNPEEVRKRFAAEVGVLAIGVLVPRRIWLPPAPTVPPVLDATPPPAVPLHLLRPIWPVSKNARATSSIMPGV